MIKRLLYFCIVFSQSANVLSQGDVAFTSSNLPIIIISTGGATIPDDPKITADIGIIYNGTGTENHPTDPLNHDGSHLGL